MKIKNIGTIGIMVLSSSVYANYPAFVGDVAARDLDFTGAGWAGHTALSSADYYLMRPTMVLESMNTPPHIRQTPLNDFKKASSFWGSRGGLLKPGSYDHFTVANRVVRQYFACPDYSYTWVWKAGTITSDAKPITCALFRCDTIINFAYEFNDHHLPTYNTKWTTPMGVWNSFFIDTDLLIPERYKSHTLDYPLTNETIDSINEQNLKDLNVQIFYQMLQNSENISIEQINNLWDLLESKEINKQIKVLFYNFIISQDVAHLTDDIIKRSKNERGNARHQLLLILQSIYQNKPNENNLKSIINYFKELQNEDLNKDDAGIVYRGIAILSPKDIRTEKQNLINMDKIHIDVFRIKSDKNNELTYVNDIINNIEHPDDSLLVTATYKYLTELLIISDLKFFSNASKILFKKHLSNKNMMDKQQGMLYLPAFIEFKAALNAKNKEEIIPLANQYMNLLDEDMKKIIPYGFSDFNKKRLHIN